MCHREPYSSVVLISQYGWISKHFFSMISGSLSMYAQPLFWLFYRGRKASPKNLKKGSSRKVPQAPPRAFIKTSTSQPEWRGKMLKACNLKFKCYRGSNISDIGMSFILLMQIWRLHRGTFALNKLGLTKETRTSTSGAGNCSELPA